MSLVSKIESTKEKVKKTEALIEKTHSGEE